MHEPERTRRDAERAALEWATLLVDALTALERPDISAADEETLTRLLCNHHL
jgi:hypothetical protein